jgi:hypothetical protein
MGAGAAMAGGEMRKKGGEMGRSTRDSENKVGHTVSPSKMPTARWIGRVPRWVYETTRPVAGMRTNHNLSTQFFLICVLAFCCL